MEHRRKEKGFERGMKDRISVIFRELSLMFHSYSGSDLRPENRALGNTTGRSICSDL